MLYKIEVDGLFGVFNHSVSFKEGGITIMLGENGLGKTVILKLIKYFFDHNFIEFGKFEFSEIRFYFSGSLSLTVVKLFTDDDCIIKFELFKNDTAIEDYSFSLEVHSNSRRTRAYKKSSSQLGLFYPEDAFYERELEEELYRFLPQHIRREGPNLWYDIRAGYMFDSRELVNKYKNHMPRAFRDHILSFNTDIPEWLINITGPVNAKLVETQRLLISLEEDKYRNTVLKFSAQLVETIKTRRSIATDLASKLDRTYTNRLIEKFSVDAQLSDLRLEDGIASLQSKREFLNDVGLLDIDEEYIQPINNTIFDKPELRGVLQIYIEDSTQKLSVYNDLGEKINVFLGIINKRFKNKKLSINKNTGLVFTSKVNNQDIPLSGLSSGEQHLIVLFFELVFNTDAQSMLLIDEPEISLHITWQKEFIQDLRDVIKLNNLNVIIATHSPDIIGSFWNLTTSLSDNNDI